MSDPKDPPKDHTDVSEENGELATRGVDAPADDGSGGPGAEVRQLFEAPIEPVHMLALAQADLARALGEAAGRGAAALEGGGLPAGIGEDDDDLEYAISTHRVAWRAAERAGWTEQRLRKVGLVPPPWPTPEEN